MSKEQPLKENYGIIQYNVGFIFIAQAIDYIVYNNIVLTKVIAEISEHSNIAKNRVKKHEQSDTPTCCKQTPRLA